jgi:hypothetical protein
MSLALVSSQPQPQAPPVNTTENDAFDGHPDIGKLRRQFMEYADAKGGKDGEIDEQRSADAYFHGYHYTKEQIEKYNERGQPPITFNFIADVLNGTAGILEKTRGDPKAFPRNEAAGEGAEIATQCLRYVTDASQWGDKEIDGLLQGMVRGIAVAMLDTIPGDMGDEDVSVSVIDGRTFFYDPRSVEPDFGDARFKGISKWATPDDVEELIPGTREKVENAIDESETTDFDIDRENLWVQNRKRVRLVEHWYKYQGEWFVCIYASGVELLRSPSTFFDEKGKPICRFIPFAGMIDHEGTHYGFVRNLKGPQDAVNQHRSKAIWLMNTRQVMANRAALGGDNDINEFRRQAAKPDGLMVWDGPAELKPDVLQPSQEFLQQTQYYQDAKQQLESFGPSMAALSEAAADASGRALAMRTQAGMAKMGLFLKAYRNWRLRIYRALWVAIQRNWTAQRMIRVTQDQGIAQFAQQQQGQPQPNTRFMEINKLGVDQYGRPALVNAIGQIDVDIILDEGTDSVNVMADVFDLLQSLVQNKVPIPPAAILEASALPDSQKKKLIGLLTQPDPAKQAEQQAVIDNKNADTEHKHAQAGHAQALTNKDNAQAAKTVLDAAHAHADRRIQTLHGGLGPDHFIPQAASLPPGAALPQEPPPLEQMGTQQ